MKSLLHIKIIIVLFISTLSYIASSQSLYFPPNTGNWDTISPTVAYTWCDDGTQNLHQFLEDKNTKAFIILKDGKLMVEWYFDSFTQDSIWYWASAGKSLTATMVGIAQEEGHLNINDISSQHQGNGWTNCSTTDEQLITIRNQLTMTTGLNTNNVNLDCTVDSCLTCFAAPDTRWHYHNAPYTLLDKVVENATGMGYNAYLHTRINQKIGSNIFYTSLGYNNVAFSTPRDMARFGLLTLAKGIWNNTTVLGDTSYYNDMISTSQTLNPSYGYLWWLNGKNQYMLPGSQITFIGNLIPNAPYDMFAALGKNDQKIYVIPSENMVVVRVGNSAGIPLFAASSFDNELWHHIENAKCNISSIKQQKVIGFRLYPNPTEGQLEFSSKQEVKKIEVINTIGQVVLITKNVSNRLNINHLNNGFYFLKIHFKNGNHHITKILKY